MTAPRRPGARQARARGARVVVEKRRLCVGSSRNIQVAATATMPTAKIRRLAQHANAENAGTSGVYTRMPMPPHRHFHAPFFTTDRG